MPDHPARVSSRCSLLVATVALVAALAPGASAAPYPFPVHTTDLWLTPETAQLNGTEGSVRLLSPQMPQGPASDLPFVPIVAQFMPELGARSAAWYLPTPWNSTRSLSGDLHADLYFFVNVEATTRIHVQVDSVAPDGTATLIGQQDQRASLQNLVPHHLRFDLAATGANLAKGHLLRLQVLVDDVDVLTWLQYGSDDAPSGVRFRHTLADGDADGIPDDDDPCPTDPDCDNNGQPDGGQTVNNNSTVNHSGGGGGGSGSASNATGPVTYYQYYLAGETPPIPPPGSGLDPTVTAPKAQDLEMLGGAALGVTGLLLTLGGLFGRHPL